MADEELTTKVSVEGFADFEAIFKKMAADLDAAGKALDDLGGESKKAGAGLDEAGKSTKKMGMSLTDLKSGIDLAIGTIKTLAAIAKQVFVFAEEGAGVIQLTESFGRLGISIESLRAAAGGTMSDMALMASTNKALAGTQGELRAQITASIPKLIEMARAAVKLDPTLGSVDHAFMSLVAGIKKGQPLLIDNTNAIVNVAAANKRWADANGIAVTAMSASQKQMALLEETLGAGKTMLDQVGGSLESATDGFAMFAAETANKSNSLKASFAEIFSPFVLSIAEGMKAEREFNAMFPEFKGSVEMRAVAIANYAEQTQRADEAQKELAASGRIIGPMMQEVAAVTFEVTEAMLDETGAVIDSSEAWDQYNTAANQTTGIQLAVTEAVAASSQAVNAYRAALGGAISNEMIAFRDREGELIAKGEELRAKISELEKKQYLTAAQKEELEELRKQLGENGKAVDDNAAKHEEATKRILLGFLEQRLGMDGLTTEELMALQKMANEWGLLDDATYEAIKSIDGYASSAENGASDTDTLISRLDTLSDRLLGLPKEIPIRIVITTEGSIPNIPGKGEGPVAMQHGGTTPGGSFIAGDQGAELITGVRGGGRVMSAPTTARMMAQGNVTNNNFNLTTNSLTRPGGLKLEFDTMGMGSR